jgi:hypothetical protein
LGRKQKKAREKKLKEWEMEKDLLTSLGWDFTTPVEFTKRGIYTEEELAK